ncbi:MAG TPA: NUDIX domain-containing protein [Desulfosalsimonadaceae bacterium]|nr:NUDIX domain-containing protein [Desulfosalsimonadaceae bacterium]
MTKKSAGIFMYRFREMKLQVFLVHPGGPFWSRKDKAAWSIPKGEFDDLEAPLEAAKREFQEETGMPVTGDFINLGEIKQPGRKIIYVWAVEGDCDPAAIKSNTFEMQWPPNSGKYKSFPEVDRAGWFSLGAAREKLHKGQVVLIDRLAEKLGVDLDS